MGEVYGLVAKTIIPLELWSLDVSHGTTLCLLLTLDKSIPLVLYFLICKMGIILFSTHLTRYVGQE